MVLDFFVGVILLGSMLHLTFGLWRVPMISPFGRSNGANILYGCLVLTLALGLYIYAHGLAALMQNAVMLGGVFAIAYAVVLGLWLRHTGRIEAP